MKDSAMPNTLAPFQADHRRRSSGSFHFHWNRDCDVCDGLFRLEARIDWIRVLLPVALLGFHCSTYCFTLRGPFAPGTGAWATVQNGGFEDGLVGWQQDTSGNAKGTFSLTAVPFSGKYSVRSQPANRGATPGFALYSTPMPVKREGYVLSGFVFIPKPATGVNFYLDLNDIPGENQAIADNVVGEWQFVWSEFTPPISTNFARVRLVEDGVFSTNSVCYFDEIALTPKSLFKPPLRIGRLSLSVDGDTIINAPSYSKTNVVTAANSVRIQLRTSFNGGFIFYSLDGSQPSYSWKPYLGELVLTNSAVLRAVAYSFDFVSSTEAGPVVFNIFPKFVSEGIRPGAKIWEFDTDEKSVGWAAAPAVADNNTIYVTSGKKLVALAPNGSLRWSLKLYDVNPGLREPVIGTDGTIYAGFLRAIEPDGTLKWAVDTDYVRETVPAIGKDGTIYLSGYNKLTALTPGGVKWIFNFGVSGREITPGSPVLGLDGTIYLGTRYASFVSDYKFFAIDPTGMKKWEYTLTAQPCGTPGIGADGTVYAPAGFLYALSPGGSNLWTRMISMSAVQSSSPEDQTVQRKSNARLSQLPPTIGGAPPTGTQPAPIQPSPVTPWMNPNAVSMGEDGTIYYASQGASVTALKPDGSSKWTTGGFGYFQSPPCIGRNGLYLVARDPTCRLIALDFAGQVLWQTPLDGQAAGAPVLTTNGVLYVVTDSGKVYAVQAADQPARNSWPMLGRSQAHSSRIDPQSPVLIQQPLSRDVANGTDLALQCLAFGIPPPKYVWRLNGNIIADATNHILTLVNLQTNHSGSYSVFAYNEYGFSLSTDAVVNVRHVPRFTVRTESKGQGTVSLSPWQPNYLHGSTVSIQANAAPKFSFAGWTGDVSGMNNPITAVVTNNMAVVAHFVPVWSLSLPTSQGGVVLVEPNFKQYLDKTTVFLTAIARDGFGFAGWNGDLTGTNNPASLVMNGNKAVTADFVSTALTIVAEGLGSVSKSPDKPFYALGDAVVLLATAARWHQFNRWGDSGTNNPRTVTIGKKNAYTAIFAPTQALETLLLRGVSRVAPVGTPAILINDQFVIAGAKTNAQSARIELRTSFSAGQIFYTLDGSKPTFLSELYGGPFSVGRSSTIRAVAYNADFTQAVEADPVELTILPAYTLTTSIKGGGRAVVEPLMPSYLKGQSVSVTAIPSSGWTFLYWLGDGFGTNSVLQLTLNRNLTVQPVFGTRLRTTSTGNGWILRKPDQPFYPYGSVVHLIGIPENGNYFAAWGGAARGRINPLSFVVTSESSGISALFAPLGANQAALAVIENGFGTVVVAPATNVFSKGQSVSLMALPDPHQRFTGWGGDASGNQNPLSITLDSYKRITADFTQRPTLTIQSGLGGLTDDGFRLLINGEEGAIYSIEISHDLVNWARFIAVTNVLSTMPLVDSQATNVSNRFYRLVLLK